MPQRDSVEFTAGVLIGTLLGAGLTYLAVFGRGRGGVEGVLSEIGEETRELGETFLDAVRDEAESVVRESGGGLLGVVRSLTPKPNGR